jgi:hypothetical protein
LLLQFVTKTNELPMEFILKDAVSTYGRHQRGRDDSAAPSI